jgi:hypothetical protein
MRGSDRCDFDGPSISAFCKSDSRLRLIFESPEKFLKIIVFLENLEFR